MNQFKITVHEGKDNHFLIAIKAFDSNFTFIFNSKENHYKVSTNLSIEDLKSFTSVKNAEYIDSVNSWAQRNGYGNGWETSSMPLQHTLVKKWSPILDSEFGDPITRDIDRLNISILLENQCRVNKGRESSITLDKKMETYQKYALPLIRREYPSNICMKLCSTFAHSLDHGKHQEYKLKRIIDNKIKIIDGIVNVGMKKTISHYTLDLIDDLQFIKKIDVEAMMLEALQYEVNAGMEEHLIETMKKCSLNPKLGGETEINEINVNELSEFYMPEQIVSEIFVRSDCIGKLTKIGMGNFVICSADMLPIISKSSYFKNIGTKTDYKNAVNIGYLDDGKNRINIFIDYRHKESYSIIGLIGEQPGESGVAFVPSIPYIFTQGQSFDGSNPKINIGSSWSIVGDVVNSGHFYRYIKYNNVKEGIAKMNLIM